MSAPKVTIGIPSYNHARFLPAALQSALDQTYGNIEVVVVDDGSTDDSLQIARSYAARYPSQVKVYTHPGNQNRGISATVNLIIEKSDGVYHCGLPSDDVLYPDKIAHQVEYMEAHPEAGFVYSYADAIDESGRPLAQIIGADITSDPLTLLIQGNPIPGVTVLIRRECYDKVGVFDEQLVAQDWEMWIRFLSHYKVGFLNRSTAMFRVHHYNTSVGVAPEVYLDRMLAALLRLEPRMAAIGGALSDRRIRALVGLQISYLFFCKGEKTKAAEWLSSVFDTDPSLCTDDDYLGQWLASRSDYEIQPLPGTVGDQEFAEWFQTLSRTVVGNSCARSLKRVTARQLANAAFNNRHDSRKARRLALRSLKNDLRCIGNRALLAVFVETLIGPKTTDRMRRLKKDFVSRWQIPPNDTSLKRL